MQKLLLAAVLLAGAGAAQGAPAGTLVTIDGQRREGSPMVTADGRVHLATAAGETVLALDDVLTFAVPGAAPRPAEAPHRVWLRSGAELPATAIAGRAAAAGKPAVLTVQLPVGASVELPLGALAALRHGGAERPEPPSFAADRRDPPDNHDLLYVHKDGKGSRSSVTITDLPEGKVDFELRGKAYDFDLAGVAAIVFGRNTGFAADRQGAPRAAVDLATGEHLEGRLLELGERLRLRLDEGALVDVPGSSLRRLQVASDRIAWLSDLKPQAEQTPAFDRTWPWTVDRAIGGPGFVIAGVAFARGIGMVPRTRLTYDLGGAYDVFEAAIGIDDRGGPLAHAVFRVFVDGKVAYASAPRTHGMQAEAVRVELQKAKTLAIEVDFGKNYDLGDHCAFADARVVRR
ncbi:MAG: hypothetical protein FJ265_18855 [Planctomycetes bacterium]|nr:hypothetical protein [Planctomycetota bacterium]